MEDESIEHTETPCYTRHPYNSVPALLELCRKKGHPNMAGVLPDTEPGLCRKGGSTGSVSIDNT